MHKFVGIVLYQPQVNHGSSLLGRFCKKLFLEWTTGNFPGGPVVKSLPCNAEDMSLIPGWGTKISHAVGQLSPTNTEPLFTTMKDPAWHSYDPTEQNKVNIHILKWTIGEKGLLFVFSSTLAFSVSPSLCLLPLKAVMLLIAASAIL